MYEIPIALIGGISGVLGGVCGSLVAGEITRKHSRTERLLAMHAAFNDSGMTQSRSNATAALPRLFRVRQGADRKEVANGDAELESVMNDYWKVLNFYRQLGVLVESGRFDGRFVTLLFGDVFTWWYLNAYCHHLRKTDWYLEVQIHKLWRYMTLHHVPQAKDFHIWVKAAEKEFNTAVSESGVTLLELRRELHEAAKPAWLGQWRAQQDPLDL